jgi:hypothetical protein
VRGNKTLDDTVKNVRDVMYKLGSVTGWYHSVARLNELKEEARRILINPIIMLVWNYMTSGLSKFLDREKGRIFEFGRGRQAIKVKRQTSALVLSF